MNLINPATSMSTVH